MTSRDIRQSFLQFFKERGHTIVPSASVIPHGDPTLLFTNAGMNQFKDVFLGTGTRDYKRAVDTQKCIRVSGKHNDLEEVGRDTYHHTFFEMLGNWSFGDYYKKEAIEWAWELLTKVWGLPKERLWATVYKDDDEAEELWKKVTDINPGHVLRFDEKDNFWEMGETGPCGPCSEIHYDWTPNANADASMINAGTPDVIEIWNLVFIQYNRDANGTLTPLPAKHVDTGMGFERICAVLQNKKSNYDTDVFSPLLAAIGKLAAKQYSGSLTSETDIAMRVIADHVRALTFAIGDGAIPSNEGRGYVLRRLLRRAARFGRTLGMHEPFIFKLVPTLVDTMGDVFPEIKEHREHIQKVIKGEEEGFNETLDRGLEIFESVIKRIGHSKVFPGEDAFKLYDTYGFPIDLTELMARERGMTVDVAMFTELMEKQRERSRALKITVSDSLSVSDATKTDVKVSLEEFLRNVEKIDSTFVGYDALEAETEVLKGERHLLILAETPFYAEAGGQVGDQGVIEIAGRAFKVHDTQKSGNLNVHILESPAGFMLGEKVRAAVDKQRRYAIMRNHTATHLVHAALRNILGTHVHQAGSLVAPEYLRFDFAHFSKVSDEELADIEALVNQKIEENITLTHHRNIPFDEAKKMGALMFFGDKYGDRVNVVEFGEFSKEFCGGTHVKSTAEIGYFKLRHEGSVASGVRRIEAVTADFALELLKLQDKNLLERLDYAYEQLDELMKLKNELSTLSNGKSTLALEPVSNIERKLDKFKQKPSLPGSASINLRSYFDERSLLARELEDTILLLADKKKTVERELAQYRLRALSSNIDTLLEHSVKLDGLKVVTAKVPAASMDELKSLGDTLRSKLGSGVGILASVADEKVSLVCVVTDDLVVAKKLDAGKVVSAVAKLIGGGGGGRPHMATAGGKDVAKVDEALRSTESIVKTFLAQ
ncbi:MAG TPA: alanine--tRNA ligase [Bacteroidota bacterium]|nr:alanine--tRNA ligase [Bacteroidota bacterium]